MFLGPRLFGLANQAVGFILRHLTATNHELHQVTGTLDGERRQSRGGIDNVSHGARHLAAGLHADFMRLGSHFGHGVSYIRATMARTTTYGRSGRCRRVGRSGRGALGGRRSLVSHSVICSAIEQVSLVT